MIPDELIQLYFDRFVNRTNGYFVQWTRGDKYRYAYRHEPFTIEILRKHLDGELTLALSAVGIERESRWLAWDADDDEGKLDRIEALLRDLNLAMLREGKRPGREGHGWILLDRRLPAADLLRFAQEIEAHAGVPEGDIEFFPKSANGMSQLRAPLGIHRKPGANNARGWFEGPARDVETQLRWLAEQPLNSAQVICGIVEGLRQKDRYKVKRLRKPNFTTIDPVEAFADLDPVLGTSGEYYNCRCPECGEFEAYFYPTSDPVWLHCHRERNCKFRISMADWVKRGRAG